MPARSGYNRFCSQNMEKAKVQKAETGKQIYCHIYAFMVAHYTHKLFMINTKKFESVQWDVCLTYGFFLGKI